MRHNGHMGHIASALLLATVSGFAVAQPLAVTGAKKPAYGNPRWVNLIPTNADDNFVINCDKNTLNGASPISVLTGVEIAVPLTAIGSPTGNIKIAAFINNQDGGFASNQFAGTSLVGVAGELAQPANFGETRAVNLETDTRAAGKQYVTVNVATTTTAPIVDGTRETGYSNKGPQSARTGFGDATQGLVDSAGGSELDGIYTRVNSGILYIFITGNLESNNNHLEIFFDVGNAQGQNKLRGDNPLILGTDGHLNRMGDDGTNNGFTFDSDFKASYWIGANCGGGPVQFYVDYAQLSNADGSGGGVGYYCGASTPGAAGGTLTGGEVGAPAIAGTINNSNKLGVPAFCPPPAGNQDVSNGSEFDAIYSYVDKVNKRLYLLTTGNSKTDWSAINLFLDVGGYATPGGTEYGQNQIRNDNSTFDYGHLNNLGGPGPDVNPTNPGLKFDTDFTPTYFIDYKNGGNVDNYSHSQVLRTNGRATVCDALIDYGMFDGGPKLVPGANGELYDVIKYNGLQGYPGGTTEPFIGIQEQDGTKTELEGNFAPYAGHKFMSAYVGEPCNSIAGDPGTPKPAAGIILMRMDQSNLAGVTSANGGAPFTEDDAIAVNTGLEMSIDLAELGYNGTNDIKLAGFIETSGGNTVTNQVIGSLPASYGASPGTNVGTANQVDFSAIDGKQWITVFQSCPSDLNHDGIVEDSDFVIFAGAYDILIADYRWASGDLNGDGAVDDTDFVIFVSAYNDLICPDLSM